VHHQKLHNKSLALPTTDSFPQWLQNLQLVQHEIDFNPFQLLED
jgi:hypothetical protein